AGDDPELRREVLDQHRHHVREHHDPQQQEAELGAALEVGREVARVHVGDRRDERRSEHRKRGLDAALGQELFERARRIDRDGTAIGGPEHQRAGGRGQAAPPASSTRIARVSASPSASVRSPKRTNSGPPNGWRSTTSSSSPRATPWSARYRSISGSESETRTKRPTAPIGSSSSPAVSASSRSNSIVGIGSPCGSTVGLPSLAAISCSRSSERTCSSTSASSWTRSQ